MATLCHKAPISTESPSNREHWVAGNSLLALSCISRCCCWKNGARADAKNTVRPQICFSLHFEQREKERKSKELPLPQINKLACSFLTQTLSNRSAFAGILTSPTTHKTFLGLLQSLHTKHTRATQNLCFDRGDKRFLPCKLPYNRLAISN